MAVQEYRTCPGFFLLHHCRKTHPGNVHAKRTQRNTMNSGRRGKGTPAQKPTKQHNQTPVSLWPWTWKPLLCTWPLDSTRRRVHARQSEAQQEESNNGMSGQVGANRIHGIMVQLYVGYLVHTNAHGSLILLIRRADDKVDIHIHKVLLYYLRPGIPSPGTFLILSFFGRKGKRGNELMREVTDGRHNRSRLNG